MEKKTAADGRNPALPVMDDPKAHVMCLPRWPICSWESIIQLLRMQEQGDVGCVEKPADDSEQMPPTQVQG